MCQSCMRSHTPDAHVDALGTADSVEEITLLRSELTDCGRQHRMVLPDFSQNLPNGSELRTVVASRCADAGLPAAMCAAAPPAISSRLE